MAARFSHLLQFATTREQSDAFDRLAESLPLHSKSDILRFMLDAFLREQGAGIAPSRTIANGHHEHAANGR